MTISAIDTAASRLEADAVVVGLYEGGELTGHAADIDRSSDGTLRRLLETEAVRGKRYELVPWLAPAGVQAGQVLLVGLGKQQELDRGVVMRAAATAARHLAGRKRVRVGFYLDENWPAEFVESAVCGVLMGVEGQDLYCAEKKRQAPDELIWYSADPTAIDAGRLLGESVNLTRRLINEPPQVLYPESFAARVGEAASSAGLEVDVWDAGRLEAERCGALLAVARGSRGPPGW